MVLQMPRPRLCEFRRARPPKGVLVFHALFLYFTGGCEYSGHVAFRSDFHPVKMAFITVYDRSPTIRNGAPFARYRSRRRRRGMVLCVGFRLVYVPVLYGIFEHAERSEQRGRFAARRIAGAAVWWRPGISGLGHRLSRLVLYARHAGRK